MILGWKHQSQCHWLFSSNCTPSDASFLSYPRSKLLHFTTNKYTMKIQIIDIANNHKSHQDHATAMFIKYGCNVMHEYVKQLVQHPKDFNRKCQTLHQLRISLFLRKLLLRQHFQPDSTFELSVFESSSVVNLKIHFALSACKCAAWCTTSQS